MISICICLHHYLSQYQLRQSTVLPLVNHSVTSSTFDQRLKLIGSPNLFIYLFIYLSVSPYSADHTTERDSKLSVSLQTQGLTTRPGTPAMPHSFR